MDNQAIKKLEADLWESADLLRQGSKLTSQQYCMPVLGLLFLRYAYSRFKRVEAEILKDRPVRNGRVLPVEASDFAEKSALFLPQQAQYSWLVNLPDNIPAAYLTTDQGQPLNSLGEVVNHAMELVEAQSTQLTGVLPRDYTIFSDELLAELLRIFNNDALDQVGGDVIGRIYEYFLSKFAPAVASDDGVFFTPKSLVKMIVNVIEPTSGTLLDCACGSGGMFGMGLASSLSYYAAMLVTLIYFLSGKCVFAFSFKNISGKKIRELIVGGVPAVFSMTSTVVLVLIMNKILLAVGGSDAVAAHAVLLGIGNASNCISTGVGGVSLTLSGILYHEEDQTGLKELLRLLTRYAVLLGAVMGTLLAVFAPLFVRVFLSDPGPVQELTIQGVRLFGLGLIPSCVINALKNLYQGTERVKLTEAISVMEGVALPALAALLFSRLWGVTGVWLFFAVGEALTLLCVAIYVWKKNGSISLSAQSFLLLKKDFGVEPKNLLEMSIQSLQDVKGAVASVECFCRNHG